MRLSLINLVCALFDPAIPTSSFNFIQLFFLLVKLAIDYVANDNLLFSAGL